ncbi:universal stress protein [Flavobacterium sp. ACN6]|uniref:universal stress protein n=1 Tax=Flavobacterium sp. ACN6 TaxID=1920426 RepID=UPI000BB3D578|nr:universal stress protein [Flavobacterium sp. ACN6]PBJ07990.1 Universal stress protein family protein [Flavobacterium sp. ACN6]
MNPSPPIIAAVNFSGTAANAVTYAAGLAKTIGSKLILFNSFTLSIHSSNSRISAEGMQKELESAAYRLDSLGKDMAALFDIEVECFCSYSFLEQELQHIIEQSKASLVVMGMAERTFEQELLGNTTTSVIKNLNIPVLAVPFNARFKDAKKILFACDSLSFSSAEKYSWFMQIAAALQAEVEFFSVDEKVEYLIEEQGNRNAEDREAFENVKFVYKSIRSSTVVNEIKQEITNYDADILVMVPQKYGFWDSLVHISKTRIMAAGLDIPLLSIPNF